MTVLDVTDATLQGRIDGPSYTGEVNGDRFTGSITYMPKPASPVPVISSTEFTIAGSPPLDTLIGKIVASNSPTSYAIIEGNNDSYFAIYHPSGNLRTSETKKVPDAVYPLKITATNAAGTSAPKAITATIGTGTDPVPPDPGPEPDTDFPGSTTTGYLNAPGYPGSLTRRDGDFQVTEGGSAAMPKVYQYMDFTGGWVWVKADHIHFIGCRFQSNVLQNFNTNANGQSDIKFSYCSFTPLVSKAAAPPKPAWPSAGAGTGITTSAGDYASHMIGGSDGYQFGIEGVSGQVDVDHCDIWGFGNAIILGGTAQKNITNTWIHDAANPDAQDYHTDGPGYLNGGTPPTHVLIKNCTIASLGNTNGIAFQAASSPYSYIVVDGCFLSGYGYTVDMCHNAAGSNNLKFINNTLSTAIQPVFGFIYGGNTLFNDPSNEWKNNRLEVVEVSTGYDGKDGQFVWPDGTIAATDWVPK